MRKRITKLIMQTILHVLTFFASCPRLEPVSNILTRSLARLAVRVKGIGRAEQVAELGPLWQSVFPSGNQIPIVAVSESTVIAEIHTQCPLRGGANTHACYRMMEFDREVLRHAGGQFVVLQSQAVPGVAVCRVAMRLQGQPLTGLVPVYEPPRLSVYSRPPGC